MLVVVVRTLARDAKKLVSGNSVEDIIGKAVDKLGLNNGTNYKLYIDKGEESGLEVDEDEVLIGMCSSGGPMLTLCLVPSDTDWSPAPADRPLHLLNIDQQLATANNATQPAAQPAVDVHPGVADGNGDMIIIPLNGDVPQRPLPTANQRVRNQVLVVPTDGITHALSMDEITVILDEALEKVLKVPQPDDIESIVNRAVRSVAQKVADHLFSKAKDWTLDTVRRYSTAVIQYDHDKYKDVFKRVVSGDVCGTGFFWFSSKIYNMLQYQKGLKNMKNPQKRKNEEPAAGNARTTRVRKVRRAYCCPNYTAVLPPGETSQSQEQSRLELLELYKNEDERMQTTALIRMTYASQREDIITTPMHEFIQRFLPRWPFFSVAKYFLLHASILCQPKEYVGQWDCAALWDQRVATLSPDIFNYMKEFWRTQAEVRRPSRRTAIAPEMIQLMDAVDALSTEARGLTPITICVFQLICGYMKEDFKYMVARVTADASEQSIQEAIEVANENPIIVIRGDSLYDENVLCEVRALDHFTISAPDIPTAYLIWFMTFHVMDFCYTKEVQKTLEFLQRFFLVLNSDGDRREVPRRNVTEVDSDVMTLAKAIKNAVSPWTIS